MGLFEKAGKRFEQFKQKAEATAKQDVEYECGACGKQLYTEHDDCPECESEELVPVEASDEGGATTEDDEQQ